MIVVRTKLDMDVLQTFMTGLGFGSFARVAERLGRSQSAVSTQHRELEEEVGQPLVKAGRGLALPPVGESMPGYAKRLMKLNAQATKTLRGTKLEGWARLGLAQSFCGRLASGGAQALRRGLSAGVHRGAGGLGRSSRTSSSR